MKKKNIKNVLIAALLSTVLLFIPSLALPVYSGSIDGLWVMPGAEESNFAMIRESQGYLLITTLDATDMSWDAFSGPISGNSAAIQLLISSTLTEVTGNVLFTSATSGVLVITSCQPPEACELPVNVEIPFIKFF